MTAKKKPTPLSSAQFDSLFEMQDKLNQMTCQNNFGHTDWCKMGFNWNLAILDEVMEIRGHLGWKWWKGSDAYNTGLTIDNKEQIKLEVIDLLHFMLSKELNLEDGADSNYITKTTWYGQNYKWSFTDSLDEIVEAANWSHAPWVAWYQLCCHLELGAKEIMEIYTGKYALNMFRQENGYGDGSYLKNWLIPEVSAQYHEDNYFVELAIKECHERKLPVTVDGITFRLGRWYRMMSKAANEGGKR